MKPESPETLVEPHLKGLTITATEGDGVDYYQRLPGKPLHRRLHSFPGSSDDDDAYPNTVRPQCTPLGLVLKTDTRGTILENMISSSNFGILNWDSPTRLPGNANPSSPDVSLTSSYLITSTTWQTKTNLC